MIAPRDLPLLPVFVAVATAGSFTAAARQLGLAKSVVSQHVRTLEERCGVRLIERTTRRLHLTQIGEQVLDAANEVLTSVQALEQVVEGHRETPTGTLRVTLPLDPGLSAIVAPVAATLARAHASLKVDLAFDDSVRDLVEERLDVALRLGAVAESSYVIQRLGSEPEIIVAAPSLAEERRASDDPRRLGGAPWVVHTGLRVRSSWMLHAEDGSKLQLGVGVEVTTNTVFGVRDLLVAGAGFGLLPRHVVREDLRAGRLRHVCPKWFHRRLTLHALMPTRHGPPRVRLFLAALVGAARNLGFDPPGSVRKRSSA